MLWLALAAGASRAAEPTGAANEQFATDELLFPPPPLPAAPRSTEPTAIKTESPVSASTTDAPATADGHQLWLVSTRSLPHDARANGLSTPEVRRYESNSSWSQSTLEELLASNEPRLTTSLLVHGNDTDSPLAISKGFEVYRNLTRSAPPEQHVRLIVWSWPSDHIPGPFRDDARTKAQRTNIEAFYLAKFLDRQRGDAPISLIGYSFGARIITGALHLLGGGVLEGRRIGPREQYPRPPLHAVLMAAAVDRDWLLPGRPHGRALSSVDRMVLLINPQDRVLKWYRFLSPSEGNEALGSTGLAADARLGAERSKLVQVNVGEAVGNRHGWTSYIGSPTVIQRLQQETLVETRRRAANRSQAGGG